MCCEPSILTKYRGEPEPAAPFHFSEHGQDMVDAPLGDQQGHRLRVPSHGDTPSKSSGSFGSF